MIRLLTALILTAFCLAAEARADSCDLPVQGYAPGYVLTGTVLRVSDGDTWRITQPGGCLKIREARFNAPELPDRGCRREPAHPGCVAKAKAIRMFTGKRAVCVVEPSRANRRRTYHRDRVIAHCSIAGVSAGDRMRAAGVREGGR